MSQRIPRLEMAQIEPRIAEMLRPRVDRLGYLGEFFRCTAHVPEVLYHFYQMTEALKAALPDRLTEAVALTVGRVMDNAYEAHQHQRLSVKLGFGADWVRAVETLDPDGAAPMADDERIVQRYVLAALSDKGRGADGAFDEVAEALGPEQAMAVVMLVGRYVAHALIVNTLSLAPPVPSIFENDKAAP